jgi:hypothetical protein
MARRVMAGALFAAGQPCSPPGTGEIMIAQAAASRGWLSRLSSRSATLLSNVRGRLRGPSRPNGTRVASNSFGGVMKRTTSRILVFAFVVATLTSVG